MYTGVVYLSGLFRSGNLSLYFSEIYTFVYVIISANSSVSCKFDDEDICGYQDLSETGISWSHIHTRSESISYCIYNHD